MKYVYPAKFIESDNGYTVDFLDFNCTTEGDTLEEAIENARDAMGLYLEDLTIEQLPKKTLINLKNSEVFISYIDIDIDEYRNKYDSKSVKKTLTIPNWLNKKAEYNNINFSQILQKALKKELNINV